MKKGLKILFFVPLLLSLLPASLYADLADVIVDRGNANVFNPQIASDGNGHVYAVWEDTRNGNKDIYFNYSSDYGFTWQSSDIRLDTDSPGANNSTSPQIACDNSGHVYVVWQDSRNGTSDIYLNVSSNYGATWLSSDMRLNDTSPADSPQIASDNSGHVYVVWNSNFFNTSSDYGNNWLTNPIQISTSGSVETQLSCDLNGHVYVAWITPTQEVLFNYSTNYGNTWQSIDRIVSSAGAVANGLSLDNDNNGHVYIAWHDGRNNPQSPDIYFNSTSDYGNTWGASDIRLNTGTPGFTYSIWPEVACDESGHVYVTWYDRRNGLGDIYINTSSDYGLTWLPSDIRLDTDTPGSSDSGYPEISCDDSGHIYTIWSDNQSGIGPGLYLNYSLDYGNSFLPMNRKIGSNGLNPGIITDGSRFYIIRESTDILLNEIAPLNVPPFPPSDPSPADSATQISLTPTLSWRGGDANLDDTLTYDVYFGTSSPPPFSLSQTGTTYVPGALSNSTVYYWKIVARDSVGAETSGPIWSFTTINNSPQFTDFSPPDGATDVELTPTLSWNATDPDPGDTLTYDVYFGETIPPPLIMANQSANNITPGYLSVYKTYYWKVVARDNHGSETESPLLSFTTINHAPQFTFFSPTDGETGVSLRPILQWQASDPDPGDTIVYDIYFGTIYPPPLVVTNQGAPSYMPVQYPDQLPHMTVHYWKVVARDNHGFETESPIMSFTTLSQPPKFITYSPQNKSTGISLTPTLSWSAYDPDPGDTLTYDVYFGTTSSPPLVSSNQTESSYQPGMLSYSTRYYWKIVARDNYGAETKLPSTPEPFYFDTESIDIIVDRSPINVSYPQVAADGNGHVYVVWEDFRDGRSDIYFNYSSDYGVTWHYSDIRLDTDTPGENASTSPQITADNNGHVYVVWEDDRNGTKDIYFNVSSDYGITWLSADIKLSTSYFAPPAQSPKIACDNSGHVYVAWDDNYFTTSSDYGNTWLTHPKRISNTGGIGTRLSCDENGHVYISWKTSDVLFNYSTDYGNTWQPTNRTVSNAGAIPYGISMDSDENGHVYIAWHDGRNNPQSPDIYFNSTSDYGNTWGASDIRLNTGTPGFTYSIWPEVACDESGHVYVTWYDRRNGLGDIYINTSSDYGLTWLPSDIRLDTDTPGSSDSGYPEIAVDSSGYVYVIWDDEQESIGGSGIYMNYSIDNGNTWLAINKKVGYSGGYNYKIKTDGSLAYIVRDNNDILFSEVAIFRPVYPSPADKATQVSLIPLLRWRGGNLYLDNTLTYDVYFGTTSPPPLVSSNQVGTSYIPGMLDYFTTYYWQVVSRDSSGKETAGPIWSFTTVSHPPQFIDFSPPNGAIDIPQINPTLSWTATDPDPGDTLTYDVYFGKSSNPPLVVSNQSSTSYQAGLLEHMTKYYWKIVARDNHGSETIGPILSFTTLDNPPQLGSFSPKNGATGISLNPTLAWIATDPDSGDKLTYDVYFGTTSPPPLVSSNQTTNSYNPGQLNYLTIYYWKVVARDNWGKTTESPILSFITISTPPQFVSFSPPDMATDIIRKPTLSWSATDPDPDDVLRYDVYFGTTPTPQKVLSGVTVTSYQPGPLNSSSRYYWRVVAFDKYGAMTVGPLLSFVTANPPQIVNIGPNPCQTKQIISIIGMRFGDTQGTSEIHLGKKVFGPGSIRIKDWSDAMIKLQVPPYNNWLPGTTKTLNLWVVRNGFKSNKVALTITKP